MRCLLISLVPSIAFTTFAQLFPVDLPDDAVATVPVEFATLAAARAWASEAAYPIAEAIDCNGSSAAVARGRRLFLGRYVCNGHRPAYRGGSVQ